MRNVRHERLIHGLGARIHENQRVFGAPGRVFVSSQYRIVENWSVRRSPLFGSCAIRRVRTISSSAKRRAQLPRAPDRDDAAPAGLGRGEAAKAAGPEHRCGHGAAKGKPAGRISACRTH
jgi:hypothetical protein